ncbi:MAG: hypothetical protein ACI8W8_000167 [Rhodothermales bacterium]|jgi:hypothetical protein
MASEDGEKPKKRLTLRIPAPNPMQKQTEDATAEIKARSVQRTVGGSVIEEDAKTARLKRSHRPATRPSVPVGDGGKPRVTVSESGEIETANLRNHAAQHEAQDNISDTTQQLRPRTAKPTTQTPPTDTTQQLRPRSATTPKSPDVSDTTQQLRPRPAGGSSLPTSDTTQHLRPRTLSQKAPGGDSSSQLRPRTATPTPAPQDVDRSATPSSSAIPRPPSTGTIPRPPSTGAIPRPPSTGAIPRQRRATKTVPIEESVRPNPSKTARNLPKPPTAEVPAVEPPAAKDDADTSRSARATSRPVPKVSDTTMHLRGTQRGEALTVDSDAIPPPAPVAKQEDISDTTMHIRGASRGRTPTEDSEDVPVPGAPRSEDGDSPGPPSDTQHVRHLRRLPGQRGPAPTEDSDNIPVPGAPKSQLRIMRPTEDSENVPAPDERPKTDPQVNKISDTTMHIRPLSATPPAQQADDGTAQIRATGAPVPRMGTPSQSPTDTSASISRRMVTRQQAPVTDTTSALKRKVPEGEDGMPVAPMDDATATLRPKASPETQVSMPIPADSDATAMLRPAHKPQTEVPGIQDPMALRDSDTSRLARIKPGQNPNAQRAVDDTLDTETVHLKVIKEKKKQLAGILSASQTIRLRPSSGPDSAPAPRVPGLAQRGSSAPASKKTLKVKAPSPEELKDTRTATLKRQKSPTEEPDQRVKRPTLKIKAPSVTSDTPTQDSDTVPAPGGVKSTLKIKAPSGPPAAAPAPSEETAAPQKSTLKIKAPSGPPGAPEAPPAADSPGKTVKQEAPNKKDRTLKLRSKRDRGGEATAAEESGTAAMAEPEDLATDSGVRPGILYILSAVASLGLIGGVVYFAVTNYNLLFKVAGL